MDDCRPINHNKRAVCGAEITKSMLGLDVTLRSFELIKSIAY